MVSRTFSPYEDPAEFVWHQDERERHITVLVSDGSWRFQRDNEVPFNLLPYECFKIPALEFHRLIPGTGKLTVLVVEPQDE